MKLGFSEWNYGGGGDVSGAIATADVFGIFGSYGVDMSMLWEVWPDESFTYAAYDAYRNFDGNGGQFGDTSIAATTTDVPDSSVYASLFDAAPSKVVIVAINKALTSKVAGIRDLPLDGVLDRRGLHRDVGRCDGHAGRGDRRRGHQRVRLHDARPVGVGDRSGAVA